MFRPVLQAHPAETLATLGARHVTAASILLQGVMAARTFLHFHVGDLYSSGFQPIFVTWEINVPKSDKSNRQRCVQVCSKQIKPHLLPTLSPCHSILGKSVTWSGHVFQPCLQSIFSDHLTFAWHINIIYAATSSKAQKTEDWQTSIKFWIVPANLRWNTAVQSFRKLLLLIMMYHQSKFTLNNFSNSEYIVEMVMFSL